MLMEPNCILLGKTSLNDSFTVRVCDKNYIDKDEVLFDQFKISSLKYLIYNELKKYGININNDNYNDLNLWKADIAFGGELTDLTEEQICKVSEQLVPIIYFKDYFPDQDAVDKSLIFVQVPTTGKCLPTFYLSNKKFAVETMIFIFVVTFVNNIEYALSLSISSREKKTYHGRRRK